MGVCIETQMLGEQFVSNGVTPYMGVCIET